MAKRELEKKKNAVGSGPSGGKGAGSNNPHAPKDSYAKAINVNIFTKYFKWLKLACLKS